ncbi:hypothetical protein VRB78_13830 [Pseudomonas trivialis]|uniref:hypothetical protein n=1 Tax=Pseudomonas trivialis TaxID=200450 RepID=UPI0030D54BB6
MDGLLTTLKAQLYDRAVSPLIAAFTFYWCIINYRFLLVLFSDLKVNDKFAQIDLMIFPDIHTKIFSGFLYPFFSAMLYIYIYPDIARSVLNFSSKKNRELTELKNSIEEKSPMTLAQAIEIRVATAKEVSEREEEVKRLKEALEASKANHEILLAREREITSEVENSKLEILEELNKSQEAVIAYQNKNQKLISGSENLIDSVVEKSINFLISERNLLPGYRGGARTERGKLLIETKGKGGEKQPFYIDYDLDITKFDLDPIKEKVINWAASLPPQKLDS